MALNDLALSWKDHHGVLISVFEKLLETKTLVDCTLAAEGKFLKAHKIVLSACSPYLEALLNQETDKHPIIFLRDVQYEDLKTLVEFVYSGEIRIPEDRLMEFLSVAEALQIKGLGGTDDEGSPKKQPTSSTTPPARRRENGSPVPRKRPRRHSNEKEDKRPCERVSSPDVCVIEPSPPPQPVPHSDEIQLPAPKTRSAPSPSPSPSSYVPSHVPSCVGTESEALPPDISKVKKEVTDTLALAGVSVSARSIPDQRPDESSSEETLGLKQEFEQVTVQEDYSDILPEDSREGPLIEQSQPSSSHQYAGFTSEHVDAGGYTVGAPFMGDAEEQTSSEGADTLVRHWAVSSNEVASTQLAVAQEAAAVTASGRLLSFWCSVCEKKLSTKTSLDRHERLHTGEKPYHCFLCPSKFNNSGHLARHVRVHTGEKPFNCPHCPKSFTQSCNLKVHIISHTNSRPYTCSHCSKTFKYLRTLSRHTRQHTS